MKDSIATSAGEGLVAVRSSSSSRCECGGGAVRRCQGGSMEGGIATSAGGLWL